MMFGSQLVMFLIPRFLKNFQGATNDEERVQELDDKGRPVLPETTRKLSELQKSIQDTREQFSKELTNIQRQYLLLMQSQQKIFEEMNSTMRNLNEAIHNRPESTRVSVNKRKTISKLEPKTDPTTRASPKAAPGKGLFCKRALLMTTEPVTYPASDSEYEYVEVEVTDDEEGQDEEEDEEESPREISKQEDVCLDYHKGGPSSIGIKKSVHQEVEGEHIDQAVTKDDQKTANEIGVMMTQLTPLVAMFRQVKDFYPLDKMPTGENQEQGRGGSENVRRGS